MDDYKCYIIKKIIKFSKIKNTSESFDIVIVFGFVVGVLIFFFFLFNQKFKNMLFDQNNIVKASMKVFEFTLN